MALGFVAEPAVPGADIEHAPAGETGGNGKAGVAVTQRVDAIVALDARTVGQFEAVIPALFGEFLGEVLAPSGFLHNRLSQAHIEGKFNSMWEFPIIRQAKPIIL